MSRCRLLRSKPKSIVSRCPFGLRRCALPCLGTVGVFAGLAGCGSSSSSTPTPRSYSLVELPRAVQVSQIQTAAINDSGQVVGSVQLGAPNPDLTHAFVYTNGVIQDIGPQPEFVLQDAFAINNSGQILCRGVYRNDIGATSRTFLYAQGKAVDLDPPANAPHYVAAINATGQIVGYDGKHISLYANGAWKDLGAPTGATSVSASAINTQGDIAGSFQDANLNEHVFFYKKGTFQDLYTAPSGFGVQVAGIDDNDTVVFNSGPVAMPDSPASKLLSKTGRGMVARQTPSNSNTGVFTWDAAHGVRALPVPTGENAGLWEARGVNRQGDVVGEDFILRNTAAAGTTLDAHVLVWHNRQALDVTPLNATLGGWYLKTVFAPSINAHGQVIVNGIASNSDGSFISGPSANHAFVLTPQ